MKKWHELSNKEKSIRNLWFTPILSPCVYYLFIYIQTLLQSGERLSRNQRRIVGVGSVMLEIMSPLSWTIVFVVFSLLYSAYFYWKPTA